MIAVKRLNLGFGSLASVLAAYLVFLYSRSSGWATLAFGAKWYIIIAGTILALPLLLIILAMLLSLLMILISLLKFRLIRKKHKKSKQKNYVDAEYEIKE